MLTASVVNMLALDATGRIAVCPCTSVFHAVGECCGEGTCPFCAIPKVPKANPLGRRTCERQWSPSWWALSTSLPLGELRSLLRAFRLLRPKSRNGTRTDRLTFALQICQSFADKADLSDAHNRRCILVLLAGPCRVQKQVAGLQHGPPCARLCFLRSVSNLSPFLVCPCLFLADFTRPSRPLGMLYIFAWPDQREGRIRCKTLALAKLMRQCRALHWSACRNCAPSTVMCMTRLRLVFVPPQIALLPQWRGAPVPANCAVRDAGGLDGKSCSFAAWGLRWRHPGVVAFEPRGVSVFRCPVLKSLLGCTDWPHKLQLLRSAPQLESAIHSAAHNAGQRLGTMFDAQSGTTQIPDFSKLSLQDRGCDFESTSSVPGEATGGA